MHLDRYKDFLSEILIKKKLDSNKPSEFRYDIIFSQNHEKT